MKKQFLLSCLIVSYPLLHSFAATDTVSAEISPGANNWTALTWMSDGAPFTGPWDSITTVLLKLPAGTTATVAIDQQLNLKNLRTETSAGSELTLVAGENAVPTLTTFDDSASTGKTAVSFSLGAAGITAGKDLVLSQNGTGTLTVGASQNVTLTCGPWNGDLVMDDAGSLKLAGTETLSSIPYIGNSDADPYHGTFILACPYNNSTDVTTFGHNNRTIRLEDGLEMDAFRLTAGEGGGKKQTIEQTGGNIRVSGDGTPTSNLAAVLLSHWGSEVTYLFTGGSFIAENAAVRMGWDGTLDFTLGGGEEEALFRSKGFKAGGERGNSVNLLLKSNGKLELGDYGFHFFSDNDHLTVKGGTISTYTGSSFSTANPVELQGNLLLDTDHSISIEADFTGTGKLIKRGTGPMIFSGDIRSCTGGIQIENGDLLLEVRDKLTSSAEVLTGASLTIGMAKSIPITGGLTLRTGSHLNLPHRSFLSIDSLTLEEGACLSIPLGSGETPRIQAEEIILPETGNILISSSAFEVAEPGTSYPLIKGVQDNAADRFALGTDSNVTGTFSVVNGILTFTITDVIDLKDNAYIWNGGAEGTWDHTSPNWKKGEETGLAFPQGATACFEGNVAKIITVAEGVQAGAVTVEGTGDLTLAGAKILGEGRIERHGTGTLIIDGDGFAGDRTIVVSEGTLKLGPNAGELALGDVDSELVIKSGATFDLYYSLEEQADPTRCGITHAKRVYVSGNGVDGRGAIINTGTQVPSYAFFSVVLLGDTTFGGPTCWNIRGNNSSFVHSGQPILRAAPNSTLTVTGPFNDENSSIVLTDADVILDHVVIKNGANFLFEGNMDLNIASEITLQDGAELRGYNLATPISAPLISKSASAMTNQIYSESGTMNFNGKVTIEAENVLALNGNMDFQQAIDGEGTLLHKGGKNKLSLGAKIPKSIVEAGDNCYGNETDTAGFCAPKTIDMTGGELEFVPSDFLTIDGLTINGTGGILWPSYQQSSPVTTRFDNCSIKANEIYLASAWGYGHTILGNNTHVEVNKVHLGQNQNNPLSGSMTLLKGSSLKVISDFTIGNYGSAGTDAKQEMIIDGGTLEGPATEPIYIGWETKNAFAYLNEGVINAYGFHIRGYPGTHNDFENSSTVFVMNRGTLNIHDYGIQTKRGFSKEPDIYFNGGTLNSMTDWNVKEYTGISFGGYHGQPDGTFTLNLDTQSVNFNTALEGGADVNLVGNGNFVSDKAPQGILDGHWTVGNTGANELKGAAAFAGGLTLKENVLATVKIDTPERYIPMGTYIEGTWETANTFHGQPFGYRWFSSRMNADPGLAQLEGPSQNMFSYQGQFLVEKEGTYSFACQYDDQLFLTIDGTCVCSNIHWEATGTGRCELEQGWHDFKISTRNFNSGACGPALDNWKNKNMAIGWLFGSSESTDPADYEPFDTDAFSMRPGCTVLHKRMSVEGKGDVWKTTNDFTTWELLTSLDGVHSSTWAPASLAINEFSGYFLVEKGKAGEWNFWGKYDDSILLDVDGERVLETNYYNEEKYGERVLSEGWHAFRIRIVDTAGAWGRPSGGGSLQFTFPNDSNAWFRFDEENLKITHQISKPGTIGGDLVLHSGSELTNVATTPASITGNLKGTGTLSGPFQMDGGTLDVAGRCREHQLDVVNFGEGSFTNALLHVGQIKVTFDEKPLLSNYTLSSSMGLENVEPEALQSLLAVTYATPEGESVTVTDKFQLEQRDRKLYLRNLSPGGTLLILK